MKLKTLSIPTGVMRKGMTVHDFFEEAVRCNVPGLPYVDDNGRIIGRVSIRDIYKHMAVPDSLLRFADAIGDQTDRLDLPEMKVQETMALPVENYMIPSSTVVSPRSSIVKALVVMEVNNTSYTFLVDGEDYKGVVTRMIIAKRMLSCILEMERTHSAESG